MTPYNKPDGREPPQPISYLEAADFIGEECRNQCGREITRRDIGRHTDGRCRHCPTSRATAANTENNLNQPATASEPESP